MIPVRFHAARPFLSSASSAPWPIAYTCHMLRTASSLSPTCCVVAAASCLLQSGLPQGLGPPDSRGFACQYNRYNSCGDDDSQSSLIRRRSFVGVFSAVATGLSASSGLRGSSGVVSRPQVPLCCWWRELSLSWLALLLRPTSISRQPELLRARYWC